MRFVLRSAIAIALILIVVGCDPGFWYRPVTWKPVIHEHDRWSLAYGLVDLETSGVSGLIGEKDLAPEFTIRNRSRHPFILERAEVSGSTGNYTAMLPNGGALEARTVMPATADRISLLWEFPQPTTESLGDVFQIVLDFRVGEEPQQIRIKYERTGPPS